MNREELLEKKLDEVRKNLETWVVENGILTSNESINVKIEISRVTVEMKEFKISAIGTSELDASLQDFFSVEKLRKEGVEKKLARRIHNGIENIVSGAFLDRKVPKMNTLRELVLFGKNTLLRVPHLGQKSVRAIASLLLERYNIEIAD